MLRCLCNIFIGLCIVTVVPPSSALAQTTPARPPAPSRESERTRVSRLVYHYVVAGDLDTMRLPASIETRLRHAVEMKADTFVLELGGDRWRTDVVHRIAGTLRESPVRIAIWLRDAKDHRVGAGQAVLGLVAGECWIDAGTGVLRTEEQNRNEFAPKGTNHDKCGDELMRWAGERRQARGFDPLLPRLLLGPLVPMWGIGENGAGALRISPLEPITGPEAPARAIPLTRKTRDEAIEVELSSEIAAALGLALGRARYLIDLFEHRGVSPGSPVRTPIDADLERIVEHATASLAMLDREIESIETELGAKPRDQRINTQGFYRELGARVLKGTTAVRDRLDACEQLLKDDPEIVRTPPPGASRVADRDDHAPAWRRELKKRRDHITRLERKARGFAAR